MTENEKKDPMKPSMPLLIALGSLIVHHEEFLSEHGRPLDLVVINEIRNRPEVLDWFNAMGDSAFLPLKRG